MSRPGQVVLTEADRTELDRLVRDRNTPQKVVQRARIVLMSADEQTDDRIGRAVKASRPTVILWRQRFLEKGVAGILRDAPRPGRKKRLKASDVEKVVEKTLHTKPEGETHWSVRTMAEETGLSRMTIQRIWKAHNLKPHLVQTFKLSNDKKFVEKLQDVVGLYMNPPENAVVFSVDEKSQIQALERTQPLLPMRQGIPERQTHDYKRNGTTTLFAALNVLEGTVISYCQNRHRHQEFINFLNRIDKQTPAHLDIHIIADNYATHKHEKVRKWFKKRPRFHIHFTPTSSSWVNLVERWFREITDKRIRRGSFSNVPELIQAIQEYVETHNRNPKPFIWSAPVERILGKIARCKEALGTLH